MLRNGLCMHGFGQAMLPSAWRAETASPAVKSRLSGKPEVPIFSKSTHGQAEVSHTHTEHFVTDPLVHIYKANDELIVVKIEVGMAPAANRAVALVADLVASIRDSIDSRVRVWGAVQAVDIVERLWGCAPPGGQIRTWNDFDVRATCLAPTPPSELASAT